MSDKDKYPSYADVMVMFSAPPEEFAKWWSAHKDDDTPAAQIAGYCLDCAHWDSCEWGYMLDEDGLGYCSDFKEAGDD